MTDASDFDRSSFDFDAEFDSTVQGQRSPQPDAPVDLWSGTPAAEPGRTLPRSAARLPRKERARSVRSPRGGPQSPVWPPSAADHRRGQGLATACLVAAIVTAGAIGVGCFEALDSVDLEQVAPGGHPLEGTRDWLTLVVFGCCLNILVVAGAIVSEVRSRPRFVATLALVASLTLPLIAALLGFKFGVDAFIDHAHKWLMGMGLPLAGDALREVLTERGIDIGRIWSFLLNLLH